MQDPLSALSRQGPARSNQTRALKDLVRKTFDLTDTDAVFIAEISCGEVDCPDVETVLAFYVEGNRKEYRLAKGLSLITGADIAALETEGAVP